MKNYISGYQVRTVSVPLAQISNDKEMLIQANKYCFFSIILLFLLLIL